MHYFELALIEDPDYVLAMSGLSDSYSLLSWYGDLPPAEAIPKAIAPAKRAVQLDPQLAEAHTSLGFCRLCHNWDRAGAEREFRRAIELNPRTPLRVIGSVGFTPALGATKRPLNIAGRRSTSSLIRQSIGCFSGGCITTRECSMKPSNSCVKGSNSMGTSV